MTTTRDYDHVIVGCGPTGYEVLMEILASPEASSQILIIDPNLFQTSELDGPTFNPPTVRDIAEAERSTRGMGKSGKSITEHGCEESGSLHWGASTLPLIDFDTHDYQFNSLEFGEAYEKVTRSWNIQTPQTGKKSRFPITSEITCSSPFRPWVVNHFGDLDELMFSRLALERSNTEFLSPNAVSKPWNTSKDLGEILHTFPNVHIENSSVQLVSRQNKTITITNGVNINYRKLYLSGGWRTTQKIVNSILQVSTNVKTTPVALLPFYLNDSMPEDEYSSEMTFSEILYPRILNDKVISMSQLYFPSKNISGRMISSLPRFGYELMLKSKNLQSGKMARRFGILMVFFEAIPINETKQIVIPKIKKELSEIKSALGKLGIHCVNLHGKLLLNGSSHHTGDLYIPGAKSSMSTFNESLKMNSIYITDTSALRNIQPGPHTSIAAASARALVKRAVS